MVLLCADEGEGQRRGPGRAALTGEEVPVLTARSFHLQPGTVASHQWEQRRLALLDGLRRDRYPLIVATVEGLMQRTLPPQTLEGACVTLEVGGRYDLNDLAAALTRAGYTRCQQVEGPGQFALRGGILDVYSPAMDLPVRADFFDDELDAMGFFDPSTQRRTGNVDRAELFPGAETLPGLAPGGVLGLGQKLEAMARGARSRGEDQLAQTLDRDREELEQGRTLEGADRYLPLIYPETATAADYLAPGTLVLWCESSRVAERAKTWQWQMEEDVKTLMERGELAGECAGLWLPLEGLCRRLEDFPMAYRTPSPSPPTPWPQGAYLPHRPAAARLRGRSRGGGAGPGLLSENGFASLVLVSSHSRGADPHGAAGGGGGVRRPGPAAKALPKAGQVLVTVGGLVRGHGVPRAEAGRAHRGGGGAEKDPPSPQGRDQPGEAEVLRRPVPRGPHRPPAVRRGPLCGHGEDARRRGGEGLCQNRLRGHRRALRPCHPDGPDLQVYRRRGGGPADQKTLRLGGGDWEKARPGPRRRCGTWPRG